VLLCISCKNLVHECQNKPIAKLTNPNNMFPNVTEKGKTEIKLATFQAN